MKLTASFEKWMIGDGTYPPLHRGDFVNVAFQLQARIVRPAASEGSGRLESVAPAEYEVTGQIMGVYPDASRGPTVAIESGALRMYIEDCALSEPRVGDSIQATGTLSFDYYHWSESLAHQPDVPDLFHAFRVERIRLVPVPDRFIRRSPRSVAMPTRVGPDEWDPEQIAEVDNMVDDRIAAFFLVDLDDEPARGRTVPRTFID